ncbi:1-acyl-sn-glycerol-3-phosphate acyltransferase [Parasegetibacter sp. MAH-26]|uniref:1-acyl-sn-glycerol-3-phosphate acyltransferase n=1 Tax=Pinibacter aurantiacus TaxID=2851599 RepID=A0A9E2W2Z4_9BACT|nr:1-acyl-sn-glycerol-3-phosphate acyltransferase [Pinibacter aurantiacus]
MKPVQLIYSLYAMALFILLLLLLMPFFFIASFFGKIRGGNMLFKLCTLWADIWLTMIGIYAKNIHEAKSTEKRPCVFVANHISYLDIPMIVKVIREPVRPLGKYEMSKVPLFGFLYRNAAVMVDRSSARNRARSVRTLKQFIRFGISIFIFPEGTFNETGQPLKAFYDGAFRIAIETQTHIQPLIFPDTIKRMHYRSVFSFTPGICRAIFLEPVEVAGMTQHDLQKLKEVVHAKMEEAVRMYRK